MANPKKIRYQGALYVRAAADDYLYHITMSRNLDSIAEDGLGPGGPASFSGYGGHSAGRLFLTEPSAVGSWMHKVFYAGEGSDNPAEEGMFPVVLRVPRGPLEESLQEDEEGSRDVPFGESYYIDYGIEPDELEVWAPGGWTMVDEGTDSEFRYHAEQLDAVDDVDEDTFRPRF